MFKNIKGSYSDLWKAIIRPPRDVYDVKQLGPREFQLSGVRIRRTDIQIENKRNLKLVCSHFEPINRPCKELPCVIYLHGNSSSRLEALQCLEVLIPQNITLFCFDFSGCGLSEGEYISLGWYERDDVEVVVDHLRKSGTVSTIGLWGRSMGAVTALMHADRDPSIAGLVLDSAFSSLRQLAEDMVDKYSSLPKFVTGGALALIKSSIKDRANFDINDLNPLKNHVKQAFIPALFIAGKQDSFIDPKHTQDLHSAYAGDKNIVLVDGEHNTARPSFAMDSIGIFFYNTLQVKHLVPENSGSGKKQQQQQQQAPSADPNPAGSRIDAPGDTFEALIEATRNKNIGNQDLVQQAVVGIEDDEDEDLRRAIEESLRLENDKNGSQASQASDQSRPQHRSMPKAQPQVGLKPNGDTQNVEEQKLEDYFVFDDQENGGGGGGGGNQQNAHAQKAKPQSHVVQAPAQTENLLNFDDDEDNTAGTGAPQSHAQGANTQNQQQQKPHQVVDETLI